MDDRFVCRENRAAPSACSWMPARTASDGWGLVRSRLRYVVADRPITRSTKSWKTGELPPRRTTEVPNFTSIIAITAKLVVIRKLYLDRLCSHDGYRGSVWACAFLLRRARKS